MSKSPETLTFINGEDSLYCWWQAEFLYHTFKEVKQPGNFLSSVCLRNKKKGDAPFLEGPYEDINFLPTCPYEECKNYRWLVPDMDYKPFNKPASIQELFAQNKMHGDQALIIDPDCIFLGTVEGVAKPKRAIGQEYGYMQPGKYERIDLAIRRHCRKNKSLCDPVGIPVIITMEDLEEVAPIWLQKTIDLVDDPICSHRVGWICEMLGYMIAAAECGIKHVKRHMMEHTWSNTVRGNIIHYCDNTVSLRDRWYFDKRAYRPWGDPHSFIGQPGKPQNIGTKQDVPKAGKIVLRKLSEFAKSRNNYIVDNKNRCY